MNYSKMNREPMPFLEGKSLDNVKRHLLENEERARGGGGEKAKKRAKTEERKTFIVIEKCK